jgi:hypothetical protein
MPWAIEDLHSSGEHVCTHHTPDYDAHYIHPCSGPHSRRVRSQ